jgi:hypothetical protein
VVSVETPQSSPSPQRSSNLTISSLGKGSFSVYRDDELVGVMYRKISGGFDTRVDDGSVTGVTVGHAPDIRYGLELIDIWLTCWRNPRG